ncbi:thioredoxin domain-containing protein [Mesonia sp.]|uniref:thioredoxin domain-containing protein n=1 Tax=Mesonia sp. TaxID=1960830 RepID=UPI0017518D9A|nr:thioredoxin domain-containing protein [Mesonia sp.]HIB36528.1 thioredoxin domain-containing protein [Mesonia sp.]HIO26670.1 thioredoxin domain-containing protein [Flavobacteriaceae bacterium]
MKQLKNLLSKETSPYLLQHANNPVAWQAWDDSILKFAKDNNKLLLISIGYSACHWCHVMEHECFEDEGVAGLMNQNFINIKVDREERPDVDHIYMNALQIMTGQGGWPLNIVALPDGRPIWGATYLPKKKWMGSLLQLKDLFVKAPEHMIEYAEKLSKGMHQLNTLVATENENISFTSSFLSETVKNWQTKFDLENGGFKGAPKFMMPNNLSFLLRYGFQQNDRKILDFVESSLEKMAQGGIYDILGGGFSRYSVDERWHIPHFEKMLYDNAQLIELYSDAYTVFKNEAFKNIVEESIEFVQRELKAPEGYFYSSLDADSFTTNQAKEEGAFYVWKKEELQHLLKNDFELFAAYFNINRNGYWEDQKYVLIQTKTSQEITDLSSISEIELKQRIKNCKKILFKERQKRDAPGLDDKGLTSWNAMMIKALAKAYKVFQHKEYLDRTKKALNFITNNLLNELQLYRSYKNKKSISATLEDYAFLIDALLEIYQTTYEASYLELAKQLTEKVIEEFYDEKSKFFFYTSKEVQLIQRTIDTQDNVIPASNSVMAHNLFKLSKFYLKTEWEHIARTMLQKIQPQIKDFISGYSNWLSLYLNFTESFYELVFSVENKINIKKIQQTYLPQVLVASAENKIPLTLGKKFKDELYYLCENSSCQAPEKVLENVLMKLQH